MKVGQLTKQPDEEVSSRSLVLLLLDHCLLLHPQQLARLENNLPACTVGSLRENSVESLLECIRELILQDNPRRSSPLSVRLRYKTFESHGREPMIFG